VGELQASFLLADGKRWAAEKNIRFTTLRQMEEAAEKNIRFTR